MKKLLIVGVILLLICVSIPSTGRVVEQSSTVSTDGNIFYVGGSGSGNYTSIQQAVDMATDGDTVFVFNGSYKENVRIEKSINVIGEDKNTTFVSGVFEKPFITFYLKTGNIKLKGFTITNGDKKIYVYSEDPIANICISDCNIIDDGIRGLEIDGGWVENVTIKRCYFDNDIDCAVYIGAYFGGEVSGVSLESCRVYEDGLYFYNIKNIKIADCDFLESEINIRSRSQKNIRVYNCTMDSSHEISLFIEGSDITVENCTITNSSWAAIRIDNSKRAVVRNCFMKNYVYKDCDGVSLSGTNNFLMENCIIENMNIGFYAFGVGWNTRVENCHIANNKVGMQYFNRGLFNRYIQNNFINNTKQLRNEGGRFIINIYKQNFWSDWNGTGAYHVHGFFNWDKNPASMPYDIEV